MIARLFSLVILCGLLSACSDGQSMLQKPAPEVITEQSLIHPPWQTLVRAGAGAAKDMDLETLNGPQAKPADLQQPLQVAARDPVPLATSSPSARPGATEIKAVAVLQVQGASPQGNVELAEAMRRALRQAGWPVIKASRKDALLIRGTVQMGAAAGANQPVQIVWDVSSPNGKALGRIAQNNTVPANSLAASWGGTAELAVQAAADGVFRLVGQFR